MNDSSQRPESGGPGVDGASRVEVTIPADPARLPLLRSIAAALAMSLDFDIDTMADLRMAVDELAATVVTRARADSPVSVAFVAEGDAVSVRATATASDPAPIDKDSFGWMVLGTLSESVSGTVDDRDGAGPRVQLSLKVRPARADR